ncbi:hypothetical protein [Streptomyces uncialis]|uniref:Uncharacterized protein n=1 Tax=Streptomyces uncialis TaxID=1048205 RepID=A0A1Q4V130_9ACTN|nr:hypothetical protein [Streptomyces uncialis]OKH91506.1 hypothetical protein AB852_28540 [Streptomyces uncialis]
MPIPGNFLSATTEMVDPNTSGWGLPLNAALSKGTGGRNGDGCLVVKSVAAGTVVASTVSSYAVTPGTVLQAVADAAGVVPERIGIQWLNAVGLPIGTTLSLTTAGSSPNWHRVGVAGAAPANTKRARVILTSTPAAAGVNHYWENVYLGRPLRVPGNLLPFGTESTEIDTSGWVPEVNATVSRQVPVVAWAVNNYLAGGHTLALTAVAAGNAAVVAVDRPRVTPGTEYLAYAYLNPPTLSAAAWIELRFYDSVGNQVGAARSELDAPGTGMYTQRAAMVAPPTAASCSVAAGLTGASAGQVLRLETVVITTAPKNVVGSVVPYPDSRFEQGIAGWTRTSGVAVLARTSPWGAATVDGSYALSVTSATATASTVRSARFPTPGGEGLNWRISLSARTVTGTWASLWLRLRWYDAAGTDLGASAGTAYSFPSSGVWYGMPSDAAAPAGATQAAVELIATASATGSEMQVDAVALWQVLPLTAVEAVSGDGYARLTLRELLLDYGLTVYREGADGSRTLVRGPDGLWDRTPVISDTVVIEDHEAPLNVPVRYHVQLWSPSAVLTGTRTSVYVTVALADINTAWLKDPGNPQRNTRVMVRRAPDWQRPIEQTSFIVRGRRNKIVLSGLRQGAEGELVVWTRSDEERAGLNLLLDSGNTLLWQAAPGMGVTDMYVNAGTVTEARTGGTAQDPWREWTLPLVEADMPTAVGVNGAAGRTWQDVLTEFATWGDVLAAYATWEHVLLDRRRT